MWLVEVYDRNKDMSWEILVLDFAELTKLLNFIEEEDSTLSLIKLEERFVLLVDDFLEEVRKK